MSQVYLCNSARICIGDKKCLLTYEIGGVVSKFVFKQLENGVSVERSANNERVPLGDFPVEKCKLVAHALVGVMLSQFSPKHVVINNFEWEISPITINEAMRFINAVKSTQDMMGAALGGQFLAKKLVFGHTCFKDFEKVVVECCDKDYLKVIDKRSLAPSATSPVPVLAIDTFFPDYLNGITMRFSRIFLSSDGFEAALNRLFLVTTAEPLGNYVTYRAPHGTPRQTLDLFALCKSPIQKFHGRLLKRQVIGPIVLRHNLNSCGYWITAICTSYENNVNWEQETCGLGEFCTKCTSPLEHDAFMNLPRRLVDEPDWINVFCTILDKKQRNAYFSKLSSLIEGSEPVKTEADDKLADELSSMKISEAGKASEDSDD